MRDHDPRTIDLEALDDDDALYVVEPVISINGGRFGMTQPIPKDESSGAHNDTEAVPETDPDTGS